MKKIKTMRFIGEVYANINRRFDLDLGSTTPYITEENLKIKWDEDTLNDDINETLEDIQNDGGRIIDVKYSSNLCSDIITRYLTAYRDYDTDMLASNDFLFMIREAVIIYEV